MTSLASLLPSAPVHVGRVLRSAAVFDFKRHPNRESFMDADHIFQEAEELFDLLEARGVPFLLVGGLALLTHVKGRNTDDVDLIISVPDQRRLEPEVVLTNPPEPGSPFALGRYKNVRVDYLDARNPFFKLILTKYAERQRFAFGMGGTTRELPCATAEGLMLLKLQALPDVTRKMDWDRVELYENDVHRLWLAHGELNPRGLLPILAKHVWEGGMYSLEHDVIPKLERNHAESLARVAAQEKLRARAG